MGCTGGESVGSRGKFAWQCTSACGSSGGGRQWWRGGWPLQPRCRPRLLLLLLCLLLLLLALKESLLLLSIDTIPAQRAHHDYNQHQRRGTDDRAQLYLIDSPSKCAVPDGGTTPPPPLAPLLPTSPASLLCLSKARCRHRSSLELDMVRLRLVGQFVLNWRQLHRAQVRSKGAGYFENVIITFYYETSL